MKTLGKSSGFQALACGFALMARPTERLKVTVIIGTPMCFGSDVINCLCRCSPAIALTLLAQVFIAGQNARPPDIPLAAISSLMPALTCLMLLPAFIDMVRAVA